MIRSISRFLERTAQERNERPRDAGDTLVEILIAVVIIGLTVAGLVGGLAADIGTSGTHRGIASLDGMVRSFAEEVRQVVQLSPSGAQFTPCNGATPTTPPAYRMISAPYPASAVPNTAVTAFASGFVYGPITQVWLETTPGSTSGGAVKVYDSVTPVPGPPAPYAPAPAPSTPTAQFGNSTITFIVPSGLTAPAYDLAAKDSFVQNFVPSPHWAVSSVPFAPGTTGTPVDPSPLQNYQLGIGAVQYWGGSDFSATRCAPTDPLSTDLQQITIQASAPGASDTYNVVVANPRASKSNVTIPITYSPSNPPSPTVGANLTYTANVNAVKQYSTYTSSVTGTLTWIVVPPSGPTPTCDPPSLQSWTLPGATPTCTFKAKAAGSYQVFARYTGDNNFVSGVSECSNLVATSSCTPAPPGVAKGNPSVSVLGSSNGAPYHPTLTFTTTVTGAGNTPTGTVNWSISQTGNPFAVAPSCSPSTLNSSGQTTCTVNNATPGNYVATATYLGDNNYNAASPQASNSVNVPFLAQTMTLQESVSGTTITVTANVTGPGGGDPAPTGSGSWSSGLCSQKTTSLPATCTIKNATDQGYFGTFTYSGDVNYSTSNTAVNIPVTTGSATGQGTTTLTFKLLVTGPLVGPAPTGNVTWSVKAGAVTVPCTTTGSTSTTNSTTFTCSVPDLHGVSYTVQATYPGDSNYLPPYPNPLTISTTG